MANLDDTTPPGGGGSAPEERSTPTQLEMRVHRLEAETQRLRDELYHVRKVREHELKELHAHRMRGMPATAAEFEKMREESVTLDDILADILPQLERGE